MLGIGNGIDMSSLVPPYSSYSVHIDGTSGEYIEYGTGHSILSTSDFSITAWIKPADISNKAEIILGEFADINNAWYFIFRIGGSLGFYGVNNSVFHEVHFTDDISGVDADDNNTWMHVAMSCDRDGDLKFYFNGNHVANQVSNNYGGASDFDQGGNLQTGFVHPASGTGNDNDDWIVNDIAVWNSALTPTQISNIYNNGEVLNHLSSSIDVGASNLTHWWRLGDGPGDVGTTIKDQVGSAHGTLTNGGSIIKDAPNNP